MDSSPGDCSVNGTLKSQLSLSLPPPSCKLVALPYKCPTGVSLQTLPSLVASNSLLSVLQVDASSQSQLIADIRQFIHLYGNEHSLTGRAIARVLHGIDSPRFPATTWGRVRRFWRCQLHVHFHVVVREATAQLLLLR